MIPTFKKTTQVCVVEDQDDIRNGIVFIVNACPDFYCTSFKSAEEALSRFKKEPPDVVILDIHLPGINGIECTRRIRELYPATLVLICSVSEDPAGIFAALKAGASGYILKHTAGESLINAIRELLKGGSPMSSGIARKVVNSFCESTVYECSSPHLTNKENKIIELLSAGHVNKEIADRLCISVNTVRTHITHIYEKLHVHNRMEAVNKLKKATLNG